MAHGDVVCHAVHPRTERRAPLERGETLPEGDQDLLHEVLLPPPVRFVTAREALERRPVLAGERAKRFERGACLVCAFGHWGPCREHLVRLSQETVDGRGKVLQTLFRGREGGSRLPAPLLLPRHHPDRRQLIHHRVIQ